MAQAYVTVTKTRAQRAVQAYNRNVATNPNAPEEHKQHVMAMVNAINANDTNLVMIAVDSPIAAYLDHHIENQQVNG